MSNRFSYINRLMNWLKMARELEPSVALLGNTGEVRCLFQRGQVVSTRAGLALASMRLLRLTILTGSA